MGGDQEIFGEQINNINIHVFTCGQININVYTKYAIEPSENIYIEQKAMIDTGKGKRMYILDNNQLDIQENKYGDEYFGVLRAYKCATGKYNKEYMVLLYSVGGNCQRCAWVDVIDSQGDIIATNKNKEFEAFEEAYLRIGLDSEMVYGDDEWIWLRRQK